MRRRNLLAGVPLAAAAIALRRAAAQQALSRPARVGFVYFGPREHADFPTFKGVRQGLAELGYSEGRNLVIEERFAQSDPDRLPTAIAELLAIPVDVLLAIGTQTALSAQRRTGTVPIVFQSGDPVAVGLVQSLARPGGNLTGISILSGEYSRKWLELLKDAVPRLHRVGVLSNPNNPVIRSELQGMRQAAGGLGIELTEFPVTHSKDFDASLAAVASAGSEGLVVTDDSIFNAPGPQLAAFAGARKLPIISGFSHHVDRGVLMSYSADFFAIGRREASYIDRLLKGARPSELPVEQATEFTLRINLQAVRALGLTLPPSILARADEVIE